MTLAKCMLCPRQCGAMREPHHGSGSCGMGTLPVVARAMLHLGEEPCLSGTRGSGAVFFCGCPLGCVFCQNAQISRSKAHGNAVTANALGQMFRELAQKGAHNINLVTATHFVPSVIAALRANPPGIPIVYNSSGYETIQTLRSLEAYVDVYLPDFKYATEVIAAFCAHAPDYPQTALNAILEMRRQTGPAQYDDQGMLIRGTLVRHLVLPGLTGASMRALSLLRDALPMDVRISLMGQYTPYGEAKTIQGLNRPLTGAEYRRVQAQMKALGFAGYVQPVSASGTDKIPVWDPSPDAGESKKEIYRNAYGVDWAQ